MLLRAVFPAFRLLCYCDKNKPAMDKFSSNPITGHWWRSRSWKNFWTTRSSLIHWSAMATWTRGQPCSGGKRWQQWWRGRSVSRRNPPIWGGKQPYNIMMSFGRKVFWNWNKCKKRIEHKYFIAVWVLCVMEDVCKDFQERLMGTHRDLIEKVVSQPMCHRLLTLTPMLPLCLCMR